MRNGDYVGLTLAMGKKGGKRNWGDAGLFTSLAGEMRDFIKENRYGLANISVHLGHVPTQETS